MEVQSVGKLNKKTQRYEPGVSKQTGFPSPATHYAEATIDLNHELIANREATFFVRVDGEDMLDQGVAHNDVLIIDRSIAPKSTDVVLHVKEGEFKLDKMSTEVIELWGVVTYIIHATR
ncbi:translesion error-prone DNA polymerase V autoproteolytic subunit [Gangjinia marincola]|uniref:Translesion error-prone DNA polymerase V autoproteolytic subunit n=1 Tax=Gangjinia marincola TaxID=578463 RepID=A0ABP3XRR0_9FLAO